MLMVQRQIIFSRMGLDFAIQWLRASANLKLPAGEFDEKDKEVVIHHTPLGAVIRIVPWNYPILLACRKITPAVATGNSIVIKPSPLISARDFKICELAQRIFHQDVIQRLSGDDALGPWPTSHPIPAEISFTSSTFCWEENHRVSK
jgi:acyl-CoA reductase-like NAD-dependent aldehyde dehydrogenase